jgi:hypothetical protein
MTISQLLLFLSGVFGVYLAAKKFPSRNILYCCLGEYYFLLGGKSVSVQSTCPKATDLARLSVDLILIDHNSNQTDVKAISSLLTSTPLILAVVVVSLGASGSYWKFSQSRRPVLKFCLFGWSLFEIDTASRVCAHLSVIAKNFPVVKSLFNLRGGSLRAILRDLSQQSASAESFSSPPPPLDLVILLARPSQQLSTSMLFGHMVYLLLFHS